MNISKLLGSAIAVALVSGTVPPGFAQTGGRLPWTTQPSSTTPALPSYETVLLDVQDVLDAQSPTLRDGSRYRTYDFEGMAGQTVLIRMESREFATYLLVLNAAGTAVAESTRTDTTGNDTQLEVTLPQTGLYRIFANALDANGQGRFSLTVLSTSASADKQISAVSEEPICVGSAILSAETCEGDRLEDEEARLHTLINAYRTRAGLPPIPISPSLSRVANRHVRDLYENVGTLTNSWSDCRFDPAQASTYSCMWNAPQRLATGYPGRAYENAAGAADGSIEAEEAIAIWQGSSTHNAVLLNQGSWRSLTWQALGIGIYQGYAVIWLGEEPDPANRSHQWQLAD